MTFPSDEELLQRAVKNARSRSQRRPRARWLAVMSVFQLGSTYAAQLCARFDLDPDEQVK